MAALRRLDAELRAGAIVQGATMRMPTVEEMSAYGAPFPGDEYLVGPRTMPAIVPSTPDDPSSEPNRRAWDVLTSWEKPCLTLFSDGDPITAGGDRVFQKVVPGAAGQPHQTIVGAGHFLQEDAPEQLSRALIDWMA